jgi:hypothetical protein
MRVEKRINQKLSEEGRKRKYLKFKKRRKRK